MNIHLELNSESISKSIKELLKYKLDFMLKVDLLRQKVAEAIQKEAKFGFEIAVLDDLINDGFRKADVDVEVKNDGNISVVIAQGKDAIWVEFGAGVYHNGEVGSSPHKLGDKLGFTIGSYGLGKGSHKVWGYKQENKLYLTRGTPAQQPLYRAFELVANEVITIAKEVFK